MYIMYVCLFSALSRRVGALQMSIIIIINISITSSVVKRRSPFWRDDLIHAVFFRFFLSLIDFKSPKDHQNGAIYKQSPTSSTTLPIMWSGFSEFPRMLQKLGRCESAPECAVGSEKLIYIYILTLAGRHVVAPPSVPQTSDGPSSVQRVANVAIMGAHRAVDVVFVPSAPLRPVPKIGQWWAVRHWKKNFIGCLKGGHFPAPDSICTVASRASFFCFRSIYMEWPALPLSQKPSVDSFKCNLKTFIFPKPSMFSVSCCCLNPPQGSVCWPF